MYSKNIIRVECPWSIDCALLLHLPVPNDGVSPTIQQVDRLNVESIDVVDAVQYFLFLHVFHWNLPESAGMGWNSRILPESTGIGRNL